MKTTEKLEILQLLHAGERIDTLARFEHYGILEEIMARTSSEDRLAAPTRVQQLGLCTPEHVFHFQTSVLGHARWHCSRHQDGITAVASACKLREIARARGVSRPCQYFCTDPLAALCAALSSPFALTVGSTLWNTDHCRLFLLPIHTHISLE